MSTDNCEVKTLLPIKNKEGRWIYPSQIVHAEDVDESMEEDVSPPVTESEGSDVDEEASKDAVVAPKNFVERYALEQTKLRKLKTKIALMCNSITSEPENHMRLLKELVLMLKEPQTKMVVTEKKLLAFSLLHVFSDILPTYKIRPVQEPLDKKVRLKKETKQLLTYEASLLRNYKKYLDCLQKMVNDMKCKNRKAFVTAKKRAQREIGLVAARCLSELLASRYYFNYHKTIVSIVVPLACSRDAGIREVCCKGISNLYKSDKLGETSFEAAKQTVRVIKERQFNVPPDVIRTFLTLKLQEVKVETKKTDMKKIREKLNKMSRKEKRYRKKLHGLEQQLKEAEAQESRDTKAKYQTEILKKIFWVYFHILKDDSKKVLVSSALEGLSKFAQFINLEFYDDLNSVLTILMESGKLSNIEKLHCMHTVFTILSGQARSLKVDPQKMYTYLYNVIIDLQNSTDLEEFSVALKCIDLMIIKRKKSVTFNRMLAFIKRLCIVSASSPLHFTISALLMVRSMLMIAKNGDILLDTESSIGSGVYLPELEDPEYCNPGSTSLWELHALAKHYNPVVRDLAQHILRGCPIQGRMQLSNTLAKHPPEEILNKFGKLVLEHEIEPEQVKNPAKKLCVRKSSDHALADINQNVSWEDVRNINFTRGVFSEK